MLYLPCLADGETERHRESDDLWRPRTDEGKRRDHGRAHCAPVRAAPLDPDICPQPRSYSWGNGKSQAEPLHGVTRAQTPVPMQPKPLGEDVASLKPRQPWGAGGLDVCAEFLSVRRLRVRACITSDGCATVRA